MAELMDPSEIDMWWFGVRDSDGHVRESRGKRRVVRPGETLTYHGTPVVCQRGMHASPDPLIALRAAPDAVTVVHRVRLGGVIVAGRDGEEGKYAAQSRTVLWAADCRSTLRLVAADYAERALLAERGCGREPDPRSWAAIAAARQYACGVITDGALAEARAAAKVAAMAAEAAAMAARAAAWAAAWAAAAWAAEEAASSEMAWQSQHLHDALMALEPARGGGERG